MNLQLKHIELLAEATVPKGNYSITAIYESKEKSVKQAYKKSKEFYERPGSSYHKFDNIFIKLKEII